VLLGFGLIQNWRMGFEEAIMREYRMLSMAITFMAVGTASGWTSQQTKPENSNIGSSLKSITIHQEVDFKASPRRLYEALLDTNQFAEFSGRPAEINREVGGAFSLFGGHIVGRNVELVPNQRIVQAWRVVTWPEGVYSIVKFELKTQEAGTRLVFDHTGFPEGLRDHLAAGWETNYWTLLKKYLR
jgi:activator of HSP90 ATPase